ncbi:MAG TPA: YetF domain-containing protein [Bacillota bacterium]|nr:YetF domain-containing protein [Bacillota bacterium]
MLTLMAHKPISGRGKAMELSGVFSSVNHLGWDGFLIRTLAVGLLLWAFGRLIPLRAAGGLSAFDFTFFWMMGGLIASPLFDAKISFRDTLIAALTVLLIHKLIAFLTFSFPWVETLVKGKPALIMHNGVISEKVMRSNLINNEILFSELRKNDAFQLSSVQLAYYENNGHLSVLTYPESHAVTKQDLNLPVKETVTPQLIISDGHIDLANLVKTGVNTAQLTAELNRQGFTSYKEILIGYWEGAKKLLLLGKIKNQ